MPIAERRDYNIGEHFDRHRRTYHLSCPVTVQIESQKAQRNRCQASSQQGDDLG